MTDDMRQARINQNLMKQEGTGWDVGYGILFLCSKEAKWITGLIMPIDGGVSLPELSYIFFLFYYHTNSFWHDRQPREKQTGQHLKLTF